MRVLLGLIVALSFGALALAEPPHVPAPPPPEPARAAFGDAMDNLFLGGAIQATRAHERYAEAQNYSVKLQTFLENLTPDEQQAVTADPHEREVLASGIAYIKVTREWMAQRATSEQQEGSGRPVNLVQQPQSQTVYSASECIGAIVNGVCHGSILPQSAYHPTCHGEMLNGMCTGPMFR